MSKLRKLSPLLLIILANFLGFGVLFFKDSQVVMESLYYSAALLGIVLIAYAVIVFFSLGDEYLFLIVSMLLTIGIIMLFRLDHALAIRQIIAFYIGMTGFFLVYLIYRKLNCWHALFPLYAAVAALFFIATLAFGTSQGGAKNWLFGIQPSEPIKILFILGLASLFTAPYDGTYEKPLKRIDRFLPFLSRPTRFILRIFNARTGRQLIIMAYAYMHIGFLVLQREWGSALLYFLVYFVMQFVFEGKYYFVLFNIALATGGSFLGYRFMSHIQQRVAIWRDPFSDPSDLGYQIVQSLYAMSAGGFTGSGIGQGRPDFVPVVTSDFIFSAIYEELGMLGAVSVVLLFFLLVYRGIKIALMVKNPFNKAVALGISLVLGFQTLIIIGGVTKLIPLTGITLPFMSAGGSSLATSFASLAILEAISGKTEDVTDDI
ncbi:MAG: FtsW/RodA/SpoVE family cell cycle protein [Clostridia bacterium]|nr:FtsW/RodA/SpoVE family cell cycle protein [Clostridia bacterium]